MRRRIAFAAALLALAACTSEPGRPEGDADPSTAVSSASPPSPPAPVVPPDELFGQWQLVALTGVELARHHAIHLLIGGRRIEAVSQCLPFGFPLLGAAEEEPPPPAGAPPRPEPICARTWNPVEQTFPRVMTAAERIERRPGGRVAFVGPRGEAVLARPTEAVVNPFESEPGPGPWAMWGEWRLAAAGGRPATAEEPVRLLFGRRSIEMRSGCVAMLWRYEQDGLRLAVRRAPWPGAVCERALQPAETALQAVFAGEVRIARSTPRERLLVGSGGSVLLRR